MIKLSNEEPFSKNELKKYKKAKNRAEERFLAALFIKGLRGIKYLRMKTDLANQCTWGRNSYPSTVTEAYDMAMTYRSPDGNSHGRDNRNRLEGLSFMNNDGAQNREGVPGTDGQLWINNTCFRCNQPCHRANVCQLAAGRGGNNGANDSNKEQPGGAGVSHKEEEEEEEEEESPEVEGRPEVGEYGVGFTQLIERKGKVDDSWILLDSQSTHGVFSNPSLLTNIRHCSSTGLTMYSNGGGAQTTVMVGDYEPLSMTVWYNPDSLANILSLREVRVKHEVTMNMDIHP